MARIVDEVWHVLMKMWHVLKCGMCVVDEVWQCVDEVWHVLMKCGVCVAGRDGGGRADTDGR